MDGSGIQSIESVELAAKLREKVNAFNVKGALQSVVVTALFVVIPELFQ